MPRNAYNLVTKAGQRSSVQPRSDAQKATTKGSMLGQGLSEVSREKALREKRLKIVVAQGPKDCCVGGVLLPLLSSCPLPSSVV